MNDLIEILKKYVSIFVDEYGSYLDRSQLQILRDIDYNKIIHIADIPYPNGFVNLSQIYLPNYIETLITTMKNMPNFWKKKKNISPKNYSGYLEYMCRNNYSPLNYYEDHLIYLIFKLVMKNDDLLNNGFIELEVNYLRRKYHLKCASLYQKELKVSEELKKILDISTFRKIMFMDKATEYKYLCENIGYRYANLIYSIRETMGENYPNEYFGVNGIISFAYDYDNLKYGNAFNELLNFSAENSL